jgi:hypothetical protein
MGGPVHVAGGQVFEDQAVAGEGVIGDLIYRRIFVLERVVLLAPAVEGEPPLVIDDVVELEVLSVQVVRKRPAGDLIVSEAGVG